MKHAIRQLVKNPGFTIVALATLALGIGINTTTFSVLNRLLLQSLPFREPTRLVQLWADYAQYGLGPQSPGDYFDELEHNAVFEDMLAYSPVGKWSLAEPGQTPAQYGATAVTANFLSILGIKLQLGRPFTVEEENRFEPLTLITNSFWREHYNADPKVLGRTAKLNSKIYTIVGVLPPALDDPALFGGNLAFLALDGTPVNRTLRGNSWYTVVARLKPGVTIEQAQAEMTLVAQRMARENPTTNKDRGLKVVPYPLSIMVGTDEQLTWLVMALSGMVLLIACANLANLQLVRTLRRTHEIGVRIALGCPRSTLIRMLLTESVLLSLVGGALGLLVAKWSNAYIASFFGFDMPLDVRVIGFTLGISIFTGAIFGTVPAWIAARTDVNVSLRTAGRGATTDRSRHWLRQGLVVVELGLALTLLSGAGFFVTGIYKLTHQDLGWHTDNLLLGNLNLDHDNYGELKDPRSLVFTDRMVTALAALPGVEAVSIGESPAQWFFGNLLKIEGQPEQSKGVLFGMGRTSPGFFKVHGIRLLQGRDFRDTDRVGSPDVVIVNEALANKFWPGESPIGKRIGSEDPANPQWAEIVGLMQDFKCAAGFYNPMESRFMFLRPWAQNNMRFISFNIRTTGEPEALKDSVRKTLGLLAPDMALSNLSTVKDTLANLVSYFTFLRRVLLQISVLGLLLAAVGIYGVVANLASERTKEIGIRMALGAQARDIIGMFLKNGFQLALIGAAIGLLASYFLLNMLGKMLTVVPGKDPWAVVVVAFGLVLVAVLASWLPARRTTKISPTIALRSE